MLSFMANTVAPVFYKLLYMSVTALVVGLIIMLLRRFADKRFSPFWKYAMWVLVLAALIIPWRPQSNTAVMNTTERIQEFSFQNEYAEAQTEYQFIRKNNSGYSSPEPTQEEIEAKTKVDSLHIKTLIFDSIIPAVWLCGTVIFGLFMLLSFLHLGRKIKSSEITFETERYKAIMQQCKQKLVIKRRVRIVMQSHVKTPALFGFLRPQVVLPSYVEQMNDRHLEYIILHELSHLKRGDGIINTLLLALQAVYWFNPLTWFLFKFIREDMELCNDAAVLKGMGAEAQKDYSLSLVEVLSSYGKPLLTPRLLCMVDSEKNMSRRINMIKLGEFFKKRRLLIAIASMLVIAVTAAMFLTSGVVKLAHTSGQNALMTSLGYTHEMLEVIKKNKTPYIGDNSKTGAIVNQLPVTWKGLSYDSFSLQTSQEPYGLTVNYKETARNSLTDFSFNPFSSAMEENNALLLFAAIDNLYEITFVRALDMQIMTFTRDVISDIFGEIPSFSNITVLYNKLSQNLKPDEFYFAHAGRLYLLDTKPDNVIYYGGEPDELFVSQSGLTVYQYDSSFFYFNDSGLYATRALSEANESYSDITAKFGLPTHEEIISGQKYISYLLRRTASDAPDKYAYFIFDDNKVTESGLMVGLDYSILHSSVLRSSKTNIDKRVPGVRVTIEEWGGESDDAEELIFEDTHYKYSLSSIRSDKITLVFEDGNRLSLKDAIAQKKIGIDDLILNGLQLIMSPKDSMFSGYFNVPSHLHVFSIETMSFFPSNTFMYTESIENGVYFAIEELLYCLEQAGYKEKADSFRSSNMHWERDTTIEGIRYLHQSELERIGIYVQIGWFQSSHTPVKFSFSNPESAV